MAGLTGAYKEQYDERIKRLREREAVRKSQSLGGAAAKRIRTSGVSQIPIQAIGKQSARLEEGVSSDVASQQDQERLNKVRFEEQKELTKLRGSLSAAAAARVAAAERKARKAGLWSNVAAAGLGFATEYLKPRQ